MLPNATRGIWVGAMRGGMGISSRSWHCCSPFSGNPLPVGATESSSVQWRLGGRMRFAMLRMSHSIGSMGFLAYLSSSSPKFPVEPLARGTLPIGFNVLRFLLPSNLLYFRLSDWGSSFLSIGSECICLFLVNGGSFLANNCSWNWVYFDS